MSNAVMKKLLKNATMLFFVLLGLIVLAFPTLGHAESSSYSVSTVENGNVLPPHPTPWEFHHNGKVDARGFWSGEWKKHEHGEVHVTINYQGVTDRFIVRFKHHCQEFKAYKNDALYRVGKRISGNFCPE